MTPSISSTSSAGINRINHPFSTSIQKLFAPASIPSVLKARLQDGDAKMSGDSASKPIIDSYGQPLTGGTLPAADTVRWVPRRKAQVVCAVREGLISGQEACDRYGISNEELFSWEKLLGDHGPKALRVTRTQRYRQATT